MSTGQLPGSSKPPTNSPDLSNNKITGDNEVVLKDLISHLPQDILVHILSLMTIQEAGRTSVLSNIWRFLWTSYPNLIFDASKKRDELYYVPDDNKSLELEKQLYVNSVHKVVRLHRGPAIDQFTLRFGLDQSYNNDIDEWIRFVFEKNVRRLTLDFFDWKRCFEWDSGQYSFPDIVSEFHQFHRGIPSSLTSLELVRVDVTGQLLSFLLSVSPVLECLVVRQCKTLFDLEANSRSLKSLEFKFCSITSIRVTAPNLVSFAYNGKNAVLQLHRSSKLTNMIIAGNMCNHLICNPLEFTSYLSLLEGLILDPLGFGNIFDDVAAEFPVLSRLKRLEVRILTEGKSLLGFAASLLKACPVLKEISFKLYPWLPYVPLPEPDEPGVASSPHNSLKVVELVGFGSNATDGELASFLIKNASSLLEKVIFDTRNIGTPYEFVETEERKNGRRVAERLVTMLRPGVMSEII